MSSEPDAEDGGAPKSAAQSGLDNLQQGVNILGQTLDIINPYLPGQANDTQQKDTPTPANHPQQQGGIYPNLADLTQDNNPVQQPGHPQQVMLGVHRPYPPHPYPAYGQGQGQGPVYYGQQQPVTVVVQPSGQVTCQTGVSAAPGPVGGAGAAPRQY